jgi:hypothetical protein
MRLVRYVAWTGILINTYNIFVRKPAGKTLGVCRRRWAYNIKRNLKEMSANTWAVFTWLELGATDGMLRTLGFCKEPRTYWLSWLQFASQEGSSSWIWFINETQGKRTVKIAKNLFQKCDRSFLLFVVRSVWSVPWRYERPICVSPACTCGHKDPAALQCGSIKAELLKVIPQPHTKHFSSSFSLLLSSLLYLQS